MSADIFLIVLFAAFMHAVWNAVVKGSCQEALVNNNGVDNGHLGLTCIREA